MHMPKKKAKSIKRAARKAIKKITKRSARKTVKKVAKKVAKKTVKQSAKKAVKKTAIRKTVQIPIRVIKPEKPVGKVTHYYNHIKVAIVKFTTEVKTGTILRFNGATTDFAQKIVSMQYDHKSVLKAPRGKLIGIKVSHRVREHDSVFIER